MASTSREASSTGNLLANIKAWAGVLRIQKTRLRRMTCILYGKMKGFLNSWIRRLTGGIITHSSIDEAVLYQRTKILHEPMKTNIWIEDDVFEVGEQEVRYPALDNLCHKRYFPRKERHVTASARKICIFICSWNACK